MRKNTKKSVALFGIFCLPTSSKAHVHEPQRGTAFKPNSYFYLLRATQSVDEGGYPQQVVLQSDEPITGLVLQSDGTFDEQEWTVDNVVATQHAEVRKNLPPRYVAAIVFPDGSVEGDLSTAPKGLGLPHWQFIPANEDGSANLKAVEATTALMEANKKAAKEEKENIRAAKSGTKTQSAAAE